MAIYPPRPEPFDCVICRQPGRWDRWTSAARIPIRPVCSRCAEVYGTGIGGWADLNRDRRTLRLVSALAAALMTEAWQAQHKMERNHG